MVDDAFTDIDVEVKGKKSGSMHFNGRYADFDIDEWHQLLKDNQGSQLILTVCARKDGQWLKYKDFVIDVSNNPIGEWGITYRRIAPGYIIYGHMGLYQRCLSDFEETGMIEISQVPGQCLNCHTQNRTNPEQYVFHVRGEHGATVVHRENSTEVLKARNDSLGGSMVYPYWHPGGRYCAFSTNRTAQMFHMARNKRIEVFDTSSDVFVYDTKTHTVLKDTLIMKERWSENTPAFSPDGKWLYFSTGKGVMMPKEFDKLRYSLIRVPFDEKEGSLGAEIDTIYNAELEGGSVLMPRISPDGRYLMYTWAECGAFHLYHKEADLRMIDLETGDSVDTSPLNSNDVESHHAWSSTGRWVMLSSKRVDTRYTRVFLAHWDGKEFSKAFLLPQRDPEYNTQLMFSYNIPEFMLEPVDIPKDQLADFFKLK
jgi:Tol biopolymer transport system component